MADTAEMLTRVEAAKAQFESTEPWQGAAIYTDALRTILDDLPALLALARETKRLRTAGDYVATQVRVDANAALTRGDASHAKRFGELTAYWFQIAHQGNRLAPRKTETRGEPEAPYANEHGDDFDHEPHCPCRPDHTCCLCDRWQAIQEYRHG